MLFEINNEVKHMTYLKKEKILQPIKLKFAIAIYQVELLFR